MSPPPSTFEGCTGMTDVATQLFERTIIGGGNRRMAVSPDGQRFLLLALATGNTDGAVAQSQLIVVQNWFEELRRLVPTN